MSEKKIGNLSIRLDKDLLNDYKDLCEINGYDMSKRLRLFIESEIPIKYNTIIVNDIKREPIFGFSLIEIMGKKFFSHNSDAKVFIISTSDEISENINFLHNGKKYELKGVEVHKEEDGYFLLECKYFKVIYQDFI